MPMIISVLLGGLLRLAGSMVGRVLIALGLGFVEFAGIQTLLDSVKSSATNMLSAVGGSQIADWAGFFRLDIHVSILLSAIGVKLALRMLSGGSLRRLVPVK